MFLFLESQDVVALDKVIALVRDEEGTAIHTDDGIALRSAFRPETLRRRCFPKRISKVARMGGEFLDD
ncbi:hypothetical protein [Dethiosulfovibrio salsuginis]|uniref:Uncharacterized protein n=1 Tax=Dethiosulfovibrio salsuginis TaxID=561720 RepID=A0A1X7IHS4_9BACT|nr:hypothetical protein [Dethiosulfovibrio salsuginis]SMG13869.1 hypothetical protein SAMN06275492_10239 [Dethiosulfovibrio salsuginis]